MTRATNVIILRQCYAALICKNEKIFVPRFETDYYRKYAFGLYVENAIWGSCCVSSSETLLL